MKKIFRGILAAVLASALLVGNAFSEQPVSDVRDEPSQSSSDAFELPKPEESESMIYLQNGMKAVVVTPETDFSLDGSDLSAMFGELSGYGMNAVIINSTSEDGEYYDLDLSTRNILNSAVENARSEGFYAYVTLDVNSLLNGVIEQGGGLKEGFSAAAHKFAMKYGCEGILLTNYYTTDTPEMYAEYLRSGSGIGYENWLYETNQYILRTVSEAVHRTSNTTAVGILIEDMWANSSVNEEGSETSDTTQALYDGYCDTKKYIESGYADFILVKAYGATENTVLNFGKVVSWWYELGEKNDVMTYVCHLNEKIGVAAGWAEDQLLRQLEIMKKMDGIGGSAFNSLQSLKANPLNSTETLKKYYNDQINTATLFENLTIISPTQTNFVTYNTNVKFAGTFDENFDVYFDGNKIALNEAGNFYIQKDLKVGRNVFTIEHKGKKVTFTIDRKVEVFKSIENTEDIKVEGGTRITLGAVAYTGSRVSASINGQVINLQEKAASDKLDANGSYSEFIGYYTVPNGVIGREQALGNISYYGVFEGNEKYMTGGTVTVEAKPLPPQTDFKYEIVDQSSAGTGEIVGRIDPIVTEDEYVTYIKVLNNYTHIYDPKMTGAVPSPDFSELPAGTLDYLKSKVGDYLVSTSGKRYDVNDVTTFKDTGLGYNDLYVESAGNYNGKSFIKMHLDWKTSFRVTTDVTYSEGTYGNYAVKNYDARYVYITFDNVTSVTKMPNMASCTLFSDAEWRVVEEDGIPKFQLVLTLRQTGVYSGIGAYYDSDGDLMLTFNVPTPSLVGKVIVIDPGHGMKPNGSMDPGVVGEVTEQVIALAVSKKLETILSDMGATVYRLDTEARYHDTHKRPNEAIAYDADMFLSLHCNGAENTAAHGVEVYYFTPFSQSLALPINDNLAAFWNKAYADGSSASRGAKYSYYWVTLEQSFPSVLVEMGFASNSKECLMMANSDNQEKMAEAIADGVYEYFMRSSLTY